MHVKRTATNIIIFILIIVFISTFYYFLRLSKNDYSPLLIYPSEINLYHEKNNVFIRNEEWNISIPKLNLKNIPIKDGVEEDILKENVGHFPISSYFNQNVCLAAHNSGFVQNYFQNINLLQFGDEIIYNYYNNCSIYTVSNIKVIDDNDFSFLTDNTQKLVLITCIANSPSKRLCVEAEYKE